MYGAEYVRAILTQFSRPAPVLSAEAERGPLVPRRLAHQEVERDLAQYEDYVANRESWLQEQGARR
jgi:hypothetical protein